MLEPQSGQSGISRGGSDACIVRGGWMKLLHGRRGGTVGSCCIQPGQSSGEEYAVMACDSPERAMCIVTVMRMFIVASFRVALRFVALCPVRRAHVTPSSHHEPTGVIDTHKHAIASPRFVLNWHEVLQFCFVLFSCFLWGPSLRDPTCAVDMRCLSYVYWPAHCACCVTSIHL